MKPPLPSILAPMKTSCSAKSSTPTLRALANFWSVSIEGLVIADWLQFYHCVIEMSANLENRSCDKPLLKSLLT